MEDHRATINRHRIRRIRGAPAAGQGMLQGLGNYSFIILMVATIGIFYFLLIRPQKKKEKERIEMIAALTERATRS